jgi:gliding motility-associated-like protein
VYPSNNGCSNGTRTSVSATVNLAPLPTVTTPYDLCDIDTDGTLSNDGLALFDLSTKESEILNGQTDVTISFHLSPTNALDGSNPVSTSFINTSPYSELLFVRLENATSNCYAITTLTVNVLPSISTSFNQLDPVCEGVTFTLPLTSNEGIAGNWSPAINNALTTEYTFTTDAGQCADEATMTVVVEPVITPGFTAIDPVCEGETLNDLPTTSNEGITGTWTPALDNTLTTNYTFTPGPDQCAITSNLTITINQKADPLFDPIGSICNGDSLNALPSTSINGVTGTWSPALDNTQTTTYLFTPNFDQCANTTNTIITVLPNSTSTFDQLDPICEGDAFALPLTSIEGITGTWSPAIDNTTSTLYTFSPDPGQCASEASMAITVIPVITPTFTQVDTICVGDTLLNLSTTSNNSITGTWSPAIDNTTTTEYTFTPNAGLSCVLPVTMTITVLTQTVPEFTQVDPICIGDTITPLPQTSTNGITGSWFPSLNNLQTTTYTFTSEPAQCADTTTMTIAVDPISILTISATNPSEDFDSNQIISVVATGGSGDYEYQLDSGPWQQSSIFEYVNGCNEHTVTVRDLFGCSTVPESTIMIMDYPKFFTPNGDSFNDRWNIKCLKDNPLAKISIFDRFGKLLLSFKPTQNDWDGTFNGQLVPTSDYWFVASYLNSDGTETQFRSHFTLRY